MEVVAFPDPVPLLVTYLRTATGEDVSSRVPNPRPARFVIVRRVGGPRRDLATDQATVVVECWESIPAAAGALARTVRALVAAFDHEDPATDTYARYAGEIGGPVDNPDPVSESPRVTFSVTVRCDAQSL